MGQILQLDRIGSLSHSAGTISLASSVLTIGGQQYSGALSRLIATDVTMTANTLYMIYAVINSGNMELRISANVNSVGPSGFTSWKLVGAFYTNGLSPIAFGSFVNIQGTPSTSTPIPFNLGVNFTGSNGTASISNDCYYSRIGNTIYTTFSVVITKGTATGSLRLNGLPILTGSPSFSGKGQINVNNGNNFTGYTNAETFFASVGNNSNTVFFVKQNGATSAIGAIDVAQMSASGMNLVWTFSYVSNLSAIALEDL